MNSHSCQVLIIGAGFGGLSAAIELQQLGLCDFLIAESAASIGGTWRDNTYPGCACDIPSHLYSLSRFPHKKWTRGYPTQPEILAYMHDVVAHFGLAKHIQLNTRVMGANFDVASQRWQVRLQTPEGEKIVSAQFLVAAAGPLNKPAIPAFAGASDFAGPQFHSMHWRHDVDLRGKHIAVIGTGASAIQFVPEIARQAASVTIFQRTAPWVIPRLDSPYGPLRKSLYANVPGLQRLNRWRIFWYNELITRNFVGVRPGKLHLIQKLVKGLGLAHMKRVIKDPNVRAKCTPDYAPGCKRVLVSDAWFPALAQAHVHLSTQAVARVQADAVVTLDAAGQEHAHRADVLVFGTGFRLTEFVKPLDVRNGQAVGLADLWAHEPARSWHGIMTNGFPNVFFVVGPNTGLGSNSIIFMIECQTRALAKLVREASQRGAKSLEPTLEAQTRWYDSVQLRMKNTVWTSGCKSYYQSADGHLDSLWPDHCWRYWRDLRQINPADLIWT
jgi:cation diffusion facilitator CzcD-associated flavoprotein CzcO